MEPILITTILLGFYASWNIGANDVANAMGTVVGAKSLRLGQAVFIAAIFEFSGAVFFGSHVSATIQRGIVNPDAFPAHTFILGMLSVLSAAGIWLQIATYYGWPVSTTHALVGALIGFGLFSGGQDAILWKNTSLICMSWIVSPLAGAASAYFLFFFLRRSIFYAKNPIKAAKKTIPILVFLLGIVIGSVVVGSIKMPVNTFLDLWPVLLAALLLAGFSNYFLKRQLIKETEDVDSQELHPIIREEVVKAKKHLLKAKKHIEDENIHRMESIINELEGFSSKLHASHKKHALQFDVVERLFRYLQITSAALMAFSHGANDVSNAIGPVAAVFAVFSHGVLAENAPFPFWILALGGFGIVVGLATWGWRVIETIGKNITELTPSRGFTAELAAGVTILIASWLGFPISTTHTLVGAVLGVGLAGGISALNLSTIRDIILSWVITIPAGAVLSIVCYIILTHIF